MTDYLDKKLLIAMPGMLDDTFAQTTVLLCAHSEDGAMGLITNRLMDDLTFPELLDQIDIWDDENGPDPVLSPRDCPVHFGGPVDQSRGFVLHSPDYHTEGATVRIGPGICLTATVEILKDLAQGNGPEHVLLTLGYAAWEPGQLEREIQANGWLHADVSAELVFSVPIPERYPLAFNQLGIDPSFLASSAGHA